MRRGFVLVAVLFALVLLTALLSGGFFEALQELRVGRNLALDVELRQTAESGIAAAIQAWDPRGDSVSVGGTMSLPGAAPPGIVAATQVRRLSRRLLLVRSSASRDGVTRVIEAALRLVGPELGPAAVRARSADPMVALVVSGADANPPGWSCRAVTDTVPALVLTPGASDSAFYQMGPMDWATLTAWVATIPPGGDSLGVVYQPADTALAGGRFTGTLIAGGDLVLRGGAEILGLLIVRGTLTIGPGGATVLGSVLASQVVVDQSVSSQTVHLGYSSCSRTLASLGRARPSPLPGVPMWPAY